MMEFLKNIIVVIVIFLCFAYIFTLQDINKIKSDLKRIEITSKLTENANTEIKEKKEGGEEIIDDWRLTLVNIDNELPEDYNLELANIDNTRKFDKRAIKELSEMMQDMKKEGITNIWVQSSYRSIEYQQKLFDKKINSFLSKGKSREEAERLTLQIINRPGTSEHNLGLAVDFNNVDYSFDKLKGFEWLKNNAENYGFILRYRKDKKEITKVNYEPWHWRYVGVEHAKKINELDMCLEEYIEYLKHQKNNYNN